MTFSFSLTAEPDAVIAVIGNKDDLEDKRAVLFKEAETFVKNLRQRNISAFCMECSAKSAHNIKEVFQGMCAELVKKAGLS